MGGWVCVCAWVGGWLQVVSCMNARFIEIQFSRKARLQ